MLVEVGVDCFGVDVLVDEDVLVGEDVLGEDVLGAELAAEPEGDSRESVR